MAKIRQNRQEKGLDVKSLYNMYSTFSREDRETSRKLANIYRFTNKCLEEMKEIQAQMRADQRKKEALEGLYLEIYEFIEEETPRIYRACFKDEVLSFGTDFGKNYHALLMKRKELMNNCGGKIKINGIEVKQAIPEINIITVGA
jgi:hypothetical protein